MDRNTREKVTTFFCPSVESLASKKASDQFTNPFAKCHTQARGSELSANRNYDVFNWSPQFRQMREHTAYKVDKLLIYNSCLTLRYPSHASFCA